MEKAFADKVAIVTGGASGIGLALAQKLMALGAHVTVCDNNARSLESLAVSLPRVWFEVLDVCDKQAFEKVVANAVARHGRLDFLFNNAGVAVGGEARDYSHEDWTSVINVNLLGTIHGVEAAYPRMLAQGFGHIVNTASLAGLVPLAGEMSYTASKYALVGLSHALRAEAAPLGVKVSVVCPGKIETPIYQTNKIVKMDRQKALSLIPRGMAPQRCADVILEGVAQNRSTIVVTRMAKALWITQRISPDLLIWMSARYMEVVRKKARVEA